MELKSSGSGVRYAFGWIKNQNHIALCTNLNVIRCDSRICIYCPNTIDIPRRRWTRDRERASLTLDTEQYNTVRAAA